MNRQPNELANTEALLSDAMNAMVGDYATRVAFAWDRLSITGGGDRMIPAEEIATRMSKVRGRAVSSGEFLDICRTRPEDPGVLASLARVLEVEAAWLRADSPTE